jgi:hypothetical protein
MFFFSIVSSSLNIYETISIVLVAMVGYVSLYEIGYLENDLKTIQNEKKPTKRIRPGDQVFFERQLNNLILARYIFVFSIFLTLWTVDRSLNIGLYLWQYVLLLLASRIAFVFHNRVRSRGNIITFAFLQATKYLALPLLFISMDTALMTVFVLLLVYPVARTMEYASSEKFHFQAYRLFVGNHDVFRVKYYSFFLLFSLIFLLNDVCDKPSIYFLGSMAYFFLFRVTALLLIKRGIYQRCK